MAHPRLSPCEGGTKGPLSPFRHTPTYSSQRAAIAVEAEDLIAELKREAAEKMFAGVVDGAGGRGNKKENPVQLIAQGFSPEQNKVRTQLAKTFGTNGRYVSDAANIKADDPEAIDQGGT